MPEPYTLIKELNEHHYLGLMDLFSREYWTKNRNIEEIPFLLEHSPVVRGALSSLTGQLVGFARVITDFTYVATVYDLIIHPQHRRQGLGKILLKSILDDSRLKRVEAIELYCLPSLVPYYSQIGFQESPNGVVFMRKAGHSRNCETTMRL